jgi:SNF2 family DNA or RNA helicase
MVVGYKNLDKLNAKIDRVASRVKKRDCIDLPPVTFVDVFYDMVESQAAEYDACIARLRDKELYEAMHKGRGVSVVHGGALVNKLLQILSGFVIEGPNLSICDDCTHMPTCVEAKIQPYTERCQLVQIRPKTSVRRLASKKPEVLKGLLEQIIEADPTNKVIIWATYIEELNDIEAQVKALKLGYVRIDGSSINHIKAYSQRFQEDPECRVYIGQIQSGVGVTLTAANYMIYYSLSWNLTAYKQSLERNNRPGQTRNMVVYRLVCSVPGALDRFLARMLEFKDVVAYTLLEKISCASCAENPRCAKDGIRPFKPGCKYEATVSKPKTITDYVSERKDET